eukprot:scaffold1184_cov132-Cylindrotheca_fusiformis.AAC.106
MFIGKVHLIILSHEKSNQLVATIGLSARLLGAIVWIGLGRIILIGVMAAIQRPIRRLGFGLLMLVILLKPISVQCLSPITHHLLQNRLLNTISIHKSAKHIRACTAFNPCWSRLSGRSSYMALSSTESSSSPPDDQRNNQSNKNYHWTSQNLDLAIPALIGMLADPILSLIDTAYVGRVGPIELAALGACTSIFHLAFNAFRATTAATTSLVGNAESGEEKKEIVKISLRLGVVLGLIVMTVLDMAGPWCLRTMGIPRNSPLFKPGIAYLGTRLYAAPAVLAIVVSEGAFRGYGDTKIPLLASLVAASINLVLDPLLMFPLGLGVKGAAAATGLAQLGAAVTYLYFLRKRKMLPSRKATSVVNKIRIVKTILVANVAMVCKQGSLLLAWAYATSRATRIGSAHVAAHQVALSCWEGTAVSAQVLMSQGIGDIRKLRSLVWYMMRFAGLQGLATTLLLIAAAPFLPGLFTRDAKILHHLHSLMPQLAWQQLLVSMTLVAESLAVGGNQFKLLATGTTISTVLSIWQLKQATTVVNIWSRGIVALFAGRLTTALIGVWRVLRIESKSQES